MGTKNSSKRIIEYNRRHITQTALNLFCQQGIARTTVEEIADAGDISKVTVYHYFPTKTDIILSVSDEILKDYLNESGHLSLLSDPCDGMTGLEQIKRLLDLYLEVARRDVRYLIFICEMEIHMRINTLTQEQQEALHMHQKALMIYFKEAIAKGLQDQTVVVDGDAEEIYGIFYGVLRGMCLNLFFARESGKKGALKLAKRNLETVIARMLDTLTAKEPQKAKS